MFDQDLRPCYGAKTSAALFIVNSLLQHVSLLFLWLQSVRIQQIQLWILIIFTD